MKFTIMLALLSAVGCWAAEGDPPEEQQIQAEAERRCLEMLANVAPARTNTPGTATTMLFADGEARWGTFFSKDETVALVTFHRPPQDEYDYPPHWLSFLVWKDGRWRYRQLLGSAQIFDIYRRKDMGLQIVQGFIRTERHGGEQSSWRYDDKSARLVPTGLDDWGPYALIGGYICYQRGHERLAHWDTRWIYPLRNGVKSGLLACFHTVDTGGFTITFRERDSGKSLSWAFVPDDDDESHITVRDSAPDDETGSSSLAELQLPKGEFLDPYDCFELLTGLSRKLLEDEWLHALPKPDIKRIKIKVTGDPAVVRKFQWPQPAKKTPKK
ncbi:hypothetical protein [Prosthecobacter sp.]|uniref:hypothetical protein n=1 Tax=Prosthecobacter sp. TaxID=1965333 RepID=UPI003784FBA2